MERPRLAVLGLGAGGGGAHGAVAACCCWTDDGRLLPAVPSEPFPCKKPVTSSHKCPKADSLSN